MKTVQELQIEINNEISKIFKGQEQEIQNLKYQLKIAENTIEALVKELNNVRKFLARQEKKLKKR